MPARGGIYSYFVNILCGTVTRTLDGKNRSAYLVFETLLTDTACRLENVGNQKNTSRRKNDCKVRPEGLTPERL